MFFIPKAFCSRGVPFNTFWRHAQMNSTADPGGLRGDAVQLPRPGGDLGRRGIKGIQQIQCVDPFNIDHFPIDEIADRLMLEQMH